MGGSRGARMTSVDIAELVARRRPGYSLEAALYTSPEVFDLDLEVIFGNHWLFCATEPEIPDPGDYMTLEIGTTSVILVRDDDESVYALRNVCRHRGSRILEDSCGSVGNLVCPYHQWTYRTDGSLIHAEATPPGFDASAFGLRRLPARTESGLIFVCLADEPPADFDDVMSLVAPYLRPYRLAELKVAHQLDIIEEGNWKLVMENNRECLHCDVGHPELTSAYFPFVNTDESEVQAQKRPLFEEFLEATARLESVRTAAGAPQSWRCSQLDTRVTGFGVTHIPLAGEGSSMGMNGKAVSRKLIGDVTQPFFGDLNVFVQPNTWMHFLSDYVVIMRAFPVAPGRTLVRSTWLVHPDAVEGVDYDLDALTEVWIATNDEDRSFVELAHRGATDPGYLPGPYGTIEYEVEAFVNWYIQRMRSHVGARTPELSAAAAG